MIGDFVCLCFEALYRFMVSFACFKNAYALSLPAKERTPLMVEGIYAVAIKVDRRGRQEWLHGASCPLGFPLAFLYNDKGEWAAARSVYCYYCSREQTHRQSKGASCFTSRVFAVWRRVLTKENDMRHFMFQLVSVTMAVASGLTWRPTLGLSQERREGERPEPRPVEVQVEEPRPQREGEEPRHEPGRGRFMEALQQRVREIQRRIEEARQRGENTEELEQALQEAQSRVREALRQVRPALSEARQRLRARWAELQSALRRAREAGQSEEVQAIERQLEQVEREIQALDQQHPGGVEADARAKRMSHLQQAIEHLRAAGLHDQAERLAQQMRRMVEGPELVGPQGGPDFPGPEGFRPPPGPPRGELPMIIQELRSELQQLRREVEELRQALRERAATPGRQERRSQERREDQPPSNRRPDQP